MSEKSQISQLKNTIAALKQEIEKARTAQPIGELLNSVKQNKWHMWFKQKVDGECYAAVYIGKDGTGEPFIGRSSIALVAISSAIEQAIQDSTEKG